MALGAKRSQVLQMILSSGMRIVMAGLVIGLAGALAATRLMRSMLFEISPFDPITFGAIVAILGIVALVACLLPARRATRIDPMVALRTE